MVFQYVLDINYAFYPGQQVIPLRNKYLPNTDKHNNNYLPNTDKHNNIRRVSVVFQLITRYKLCLSSRPTSNTTDTLNIYKYHGRSHTCKTNTYYSDIHIYISLSLSHSSSSYATLRHSWPSLTTVYQQTTLFYLIIPRYYPLTSLYPCTTQLPINE